MKEGNIMKKTYSKPEILFEDFSLSTSITAGCELKTPLPSYEENCAYPTQGGMLFTDQVQACGKTPPGGVYNGACYHVPADTNNLFNS